MSGVGPAKLRCADEDADSIENRLLFYFLDVPHPPLNVEE